jgi:hypothetical protein
MKVSFILDEISLESDTCSILEQLMGLYPDHHIFGICHRQGQVSARIEWGKIQSSFLSHWKKNTEQLDFMAIKALDSLSHQKELLNSDLIIVLSSGISHLIDLPSEVRKIYYFLRPAIKSTSIFNRLFSSFVENKIETWKPGSNSYLVFSSEDLKNKMGLQGKVIPNFYQKSCVHQKVSNVDNIIVYSQLSPFKVSEIQHLMTDKTVLYFEGWEVPLSLSKLNLKKVYSKKNLQEFLKTQFDGERIKMWDFSNAWNPLWGFKALMDEMEFYCLNNSLNLNLFSEYAHYFDLRKLENEFKIANKSIDLAKARRHSMKNNPRLFKSRFKHFTMQHHLN